MFEIFEPLIRRNCGKLFVLAGIGAMSLTVVAYQIVTGTYHYIAHIV